MLEHVSQFCKSDQHKVTADTRYGVSFQGEMLHPIATMIYWYRWGEYTFDIRTLRSLFGIKESKAIDTDWDMHPCTRFQKIAAEVIQLVGDVPFKDVYTLRKSIEKQTP